MVYPLVDFLFVVQHDKRLWGDGVAVEDETEVAALTLHVCEVYQCSVQSRNTESSFSVGNFRQMKGGDSQMRQKETEDDSKRGGHTSKHTVRTVSKKKNFDGCHTFAL